MTNNNIQVLKVKKLATLDEALWKAFQETDRNEPVPFFAWRRLHDKHKEMRENMKADGTSYYPLPFLLGCCFAGLFMVGGVNRWPNGLLIIFIALYCLMLLCTFWARGRFLRAYSEYELRNSSFTDHAFGMHSVSLLVRRVVEKVALPIGKERKDSLDALIKINKAAQEHGEVNYGFVDALKKTAFTGMLSAFSALGWFSAHQTDIQAVSERLINRLSAFWIGYVLIGVMVVSVLFLLYDIVFGQMRLKKKKKRYLLVLNIIRETSI